MPNIDIIESDRIKVVWKASCGKHNNFHVADLIRSKDNNNVIFNYNVDTDDFKQAIEAGFYEYSAFPIEQATSFDEGVMDVLSRRLPPRSRSDFNKFLAQWAISEDEEISNFALLGYSQGMLPSDTFSFYPYWEEHYLPFSFLIEIAGFSHNKGMKMDLNSISNIEFKTEPTNKNDEQAIAILTDNVRIGYVNRTLTVAFHKWLSESAKITASIHRINGTDIRPRVHLIVSVRQG